MRAKNAIIMKAVQIKDRQVAKSEGVKILVSMESKSF